MSSSELINEEESQAIKEAIEQDQNTGPDIPDRFDFFSRERALLEQMKSLANMNDLMGVDLKSRINQNFKTHIEVSIEQIDMLTVSECLKTMRQGSIFNIVDLNLVKGEGLLEVPAKTLTYLLDQYFGYRGAVITEPLMGDTMPLSHFRFNKRLVSQFIESLENCWLQVSAMQLEPAINKVETEPDLIDFSTEHELAVRFKVELVSDDFSDSLIWIMPFTCFEPFREKVSRNQIKTSQKDFVKWQCDLKNGMLQVEVESRAILGFVNLDIGRLGSLKVGDVFPVGNPQQVQISVDGQPLFLGEYGTNGESKVVNITKRMFASNESGIE